MSSLEDIEAATDGLPLGQYQQIVEWFRTREQTRWDQQLDHDSLTGKLDFLFEEADHESAKGLLREWPGSKKVHLAEGFSTSLAPFRRLETLLDRL